MSASGFIAHVRCSSTLAPASASLTPADLRDHAQEVLTAVVADLSFAQTADEQSRKSMGLGTTHAMAAGG
jgi:hypothetical protein